MGEMKAREPHEVRYSRTVDGQTRTVIGQVDRRGVAEITEELLDQLLVETGWEKTS